MKLKVKLSADATMPTYGTAGAACFDLYAAEDQHIVAGRAGAIHTGVSFEIPTGYVMHVYSRSGHGFKNDIRLSNCVGVIDSDYRGEVMVKLRNDGKHDTFVVRKGDRIAQAMITSTVAVQLITAELNETDRGANGFGSTGA